MFYFNLYNKKSSTYFLLVHLLTSTMTASCPLPCRCNWIEGKYSLNCLEKNITSLPLTSDDIEAVIFDKNPLTLNSYEFVRAGLSNVRKIRMRYCGISVLFGDVFSGLKNLHELDLSHNNLTIVIPGQFPKLPELRILDLSNNFLSSIHKNSFLSIGLKLERLDITNNFLVTLPWTTFNPLPSLKQISLGGNPWYCDCKLGELHSELIRRNILPDLVACASPPVLATRYWRSLQQSDFTCSPTISLPHPAQHSVLPGQVVTLHCQVTGNPAPKVTWRLDGAILLKTNNEMYRIIEPKSGDEHGSSIFSVLTILNMSSSSLGNYSCSAKNSIGREKKDINIIFLKTAKRKEETDDNYLLLTITICASVVILIICIVITVYCCMKKSKSLKFSSHSNSFTIFEYEKKPSKESEKSRAGTYDSLDMPGTLSKCSTLHTYLPDSSLYGGDDYDSVTLPRNDSVTLPRNASILTRSDSIPITSSDSDVMKTESQSLSSMLTLMTMSNKPYSRECIGTISSVPDPIYGSIRRTITIPPQYQSYTHNAPVPTLWHERPGYVTLPRRPKSCKVLPLDSHGPRTSADGCSHNNISSLPLDKTKPYQRESTMLSPYFPASSAFNTVGIPVVHVPIAMAEADIHERPPSPQINSKVCLDTIAE